MQIDEKNHWENVDRQYERINKVIAASTRLTKIYREDLFSLCEKVKGTLTETRYRSHNSYFSQ